MGSREKNNSQKYITGKVQKVKLTNTREDKEEKILKVQQFSVY